MSQRHKASYDKTGPSHPSFDANRCGWLNRQREQLLCNLGDRVCNDSSAMNFSNANFKL